jgi:hypothetical protein
VQRYTVAFYVMNATLNLAQTFVKLSLLFQYLRIVQKGTLTYRIATYLIYAVSLWGVIYSVLAFVPCNPVSAFWYSPPGATCWGYGAVGTDGQAATFYSHTTLNTIFDILILGIPSPLYFQKSMPLKIRVGQLALLSTGVM